MGCSTGGPALAIWSPASRKVRFSAGLAACRRDGGRAACRGGGAAGGAATTDGARRGWMAQQKRGLGRGLGALIPTAPGAAGPEGQAAGAPTSGSVGLAPELREVAGTYFDEIAIGAITPNPRQPRQQFDEDTLDELASSIKEVGLLQPVVVRKVMPGRFELIMGERRWRACQRAGLEHVPAIVRGTPDDELLREALMENLHREQLNPLEEAAAYQQLLDDFSATHDELAHKVGRSRPHISNTIRLLQLPGPVQRRGAPGGPPPGRARRPPPPTRPPPPHRDRPGGAGAPGPPDRGRRAVGPGCGGDRRGRPAAGAQAAAHRHP